jgi:hypothetical protein
LICLADIAGQIRADLCANSNTFTSFDRLYFAARLYHSANNFMANAKGHRCFTPSARNFMDIATTHSTSVDGDVDIIFLEELQFELEKTVSFSKRNPTQSINLLLPERAPILVVIDHETLRSLWIRHGDVPSKVLSEGCKTARLEELKTERQK